MITGIGYGRQSLVPAVQTPTANSTFTPDLGAGLIWTVQMPAGAVTIANPINGFPGDQLILIIIHALGDSVSWGSAYKKAVLSLSVGVNARDLVTFIYDGSNWNQTGSVLGLT